MTQTSSESDPPSSEDQTRSEFERFLTETPQQDHYVLVLFVTGTTTKSSQAISVVRNLCEEHLTGRYELEVVDIYQSPERLAGDQIVAAPTLLKRTPFPPQRLVGNLNNSERVLIGLNLKSEKEAPINWLEV